MVEGLEFECLESMFRFHGSGFRGQGSGFGVELSLFFVLSWSFEFWILSLERCVLSFED